MSATVHKLPERPLDSLSISCISRILTRARLDLCQARLYAKGNSQATETIDMAGVALRAALDVFEAAHSKGAM